MTCNAVVNVLIIGLLQKKFIRLFPLYRNPYDFSDSDSESDEEEEDKKTKKKKKKKKVTIIEIYYKHTSLLSQMLSRLSDWLCHLLSI